MDSTLSRPLGSPAGVSALAPALLVAANSAYLLLGSEPSPWRLGAVLLQPLLLAGLAAALFKATRGRRLGAAWLALGVLVPFYLRFGSARPTVDRPLENPLISADLAGETQGGAQGPFYPSAAHTESGGTLPAEVFTAASACARCHAREVAEWESSAHHHAGSGDPWYGATLAAVEAQKGPVAASFCAGCHAPGLLLTGELSQAADRKLTTTQLESTRAEAKALSAAGVSCLSCHGISAVRHTDGNGGYTLAARPLAPLATSTGLGQLLHDLGVRLDPASHRRTYARPLLTGLTSGSELCATCHKGHMDTALNDYRWFATFNDYDAWQSSNVSGQGFERALFFEEPRGCVDCHMKPEGTVSHRFAAANTALPTHHGDREQLAAVESYLQNNQVTLDFFAMSEGRPVAAQASADRAEVFHGPLDRIGATVRRGESNGFELVVRPQGLGHLFPGGKADLPELWLEVRAVDEAGRAVFESGSLSAAGEVDPSAHFFRSQWIDGQSERVARHNLEDARSIAYFARVETNTVHLARFRVAIPSQADAGAGSRLTLTARLLYRPFEPSFNRWAFGDQKAPELPVTELATTRVEVAVIDAGAPLPDWNVPPRPEDKLRFYHYGCALALGGDLRSARRPLEVAHRLDPDDHTAAVTYARLAMVAGDFDESRKVLTAALAKNPADPRAHMFLGTTERNAGNLDAALASFREAARLAPRDAGIRAALGGLLFQRGDMPAAIVEFQGVLAVEPNDRAAHFTLMRAYKASGQAELSALHQARFERFKADESAQELARAYLEKSPHDNRERQRLHEHPSAPLATAAPLSPRNPQ